MNDFITELAKFRASHPRGFYLTAPSADGERWYTVEVRSLDRPVFFGSKENADFAADALNEHEWRRYKQALSDFETGYWREEAERHRVAWTARLNELVAFKRERLRKEEEFGRANIICLAALSLPE